MQDKDRGWFLLERLDESHPLHPSQADDISRYGAWVDLNSMSRCRKLVTTQSRLQRRWGWTRGEVRAFFDLLEREGLAEYEGDGSKGTVIRLINTIDNPGK